MSGKVLSIIVNLCYYLLRVCADVVTGIVTKCLNARAKTKEAAISVCLMYIEIEKQEIVQVSGNAIQYMRLIKYSGFEYVCVCVCVYGAVYYPMHRRR